MPLQKKNSKHTQHFLSGRYKEATKTTSAIMSSKKPSSKFSTNSSPHLILNNMIGDFDSDGVGIMDCDPRNKNKQGFLDDIAAVGLQRVQRGIVRNSKAVTLAL